MSLTSPLAADSGTAHATGAADLVIPAVAGRRPYRLAVAVLLAGLAVTAALVWTAHALYNHNENRLLRLRARELGLVLAGAVPSVQTPLASAAALADATNGSVEQFELFLAPAVGPGRQFVSASLWPAGATAPTALLGTPPALAPASARRFLGAVRHTPGLNVTNILDQAHPRLGYGFALSGHPHGYLVYAESALPASRHSRLERNSAFADLSYVLYLARSTREADLLVTNLDRLPASGRQARTTVPFGNRVLTLIVTSRGALGGAFFHDLPWIIAVAGVLLALAATLLTDRLVRRRRSAERLAGDLDRIAAENLRLYAEQRTIAQELQHALLPEALPALDGLQASVRYVPGISGIEVGGDWYDIVAVDDGQVLVVVGDVSGRGLHAATTMASLRYAVLAYAAQRDGPGTILAKLSSLVSREPHDFFATVLCALIDVDAHTITLASAGHLAPLLIEGGEPRFAELSVGVPIGAADGARYEEVRVSLAPHATLVAYTDGLVERRGEVLDAGLARLRRAAAAPGLTLDELVSKLVSDLAHDESHDDTAILAVRWTR